MANGKNDTRFEDLVKRFGVLGAAHGQGHVSRPTAAMEALEAAVEGYARPEDAKSLWHEFQSRSAKMRGIEYKVEGSVTSQTSKLRRFLTLGQLDLDVIDVMERAQGIIRKLAANEDTRKGMGGSAYDKMIAVAVAQLKQPTSELTDDEITSVLLPDKKDKDEAAILKAVARTLTKVPKTPQASTAQEAIKNRLDELAAQPKPAPEAPTPEQDDEPVQYDDEQLADLEAEQPVAAQEEDEFEPPAFVKAMSTGVRR